MIPESYFNNRLNNQIAIPNIMNNKLSHLSDIEIETLIARYYNNEKTTDLIKEYKLDIKSSQLVKTFPSLVLDIKCEFCSVNLIEPQLSRSGYSWQRNAPKCHICGHSSQSSCSCMHCKARAKNDREILVRAKQELLLQSFESKKSNPVDVKNLSFQQRVYLGAIILEGISENLEYIKSISTFSNAIASTDEEKGMIVDSLVDSSILIIHPSTDTDSITISDFDKGTFSYNPFLVRWKINLQSGTHTYTELIVSLMSPSEIKVDDFESAYILWTKIACDDCIAYLCDSINNLIGVNYQVGEKTISVINELLKSYSTSQIYGIFYKAVNESLRFQAERQVSRKHVANTIIGNALSYGDRAKINNWDLKHYSRIKSCPESALSKFFFERVLKIGYSGFSVVPYMFKPSENIV